MVQSHLVFTLLIILSVQIFFAHYGATTFQNLLSAILPFVPVASKGINMITIRFFVVNKNFQAVSILTKNRGRMLLANIRIKRMGMTMAFVF